MNNDGESSALITGPTISQFSYLREAMNPYAQRGMAAFCCGKNLALFLGVEIEVNPYEQCETCVYRLLVSYFSFEEHGTKLFQTCLGFLCA